MRPTFLMTIARVLGAAICLLAGAFTASAHHSVTGIFDVTKSETVTGTISALEWINPHSYLHVDVQAADGSLKKYSFESLPPAMMRRAGVNRELLLGDRSDVGATVTVKFNPARADPLGRCITRITYADGHFYQLSADTRQ